jgi:hypothetical protein
VNVRLCQELQRLSDLQLRQVARRVRRNRKLPENVRALVLAAVAREQKRRRVEASCELPDFSSV